MAELVRDIFYVLGMSHLRSGKEQLEFIGLNKVECERKFLLFWEDKGI